MRAAFITGASPVSHSFDDLVKQMGRGLIVTEMMGSSVSAMTGDYSRGAAGFWVENGEIQYPVSEITIAGNPQRYVAQYGNGR